MLILILSVAAVALLNTLLQRHRRSTSPAISAIPALVAATSWFIFGDGLRWTTWGGIYASFGVWLATART